jgi:hypothetical protein
MSNTFTVKELADFYQQVADGGEAEYRSCPEEQWSIGIGLSPSLSSIRQDWRIKPAKKVIDLSVLIGSGIDCEFRDDIGERTNIGKLLEIMNADLHMYPYITGNSPDKYYAQCQPRIHHKHAWQGGECPLPEGFEVKVWLRSGGHTKNIRLVSELIWSHNNISSDIIAFEVLGLADGCVLPWEQDNE